jgi:hypothetical protein
LLSLNAEEFIRRFLLHVLPDGFMKIRHYGILSNRNKKTKLVQCQQILNTAEIYTANPIDIHWRDLFQKLTGIDPLKCPCCGKGNMRLWKVLPVEASRAPP